MKYSLVPTSREIDVLLALVEHGSEKIAAQHLGISRATIHGHLHNLYGRIGATGRTHAVALLWPLLHERYRLPGDAPLERRHAA
jgi:DNA-binding CsgD family transcriptional regulator